MTELDICGEAERNCDELRKKMGGLEIVSVFIVSDSDVSHVPFDGCGKMEE